MLLSTRQTDGATLPKDGRETIAHLIAPLMIAPLIYRGDPMPRTSRFVFSNTKRFTAACMITFLAFILVGCPQTPSNAPLSITIDGAGYGGPNGGFTFLVSGQGFTPNGQVNLVVFNIPHEPTAVSFTNAPGLPNLSADAAGNFDRFRVTKECPLVTDDPPSDIYLYSVDAPTDRVAVNKFFIAFCFTGSPIGGFPPPEKCDQTAGLRPDPRCH
jgi:hypothetical protein